jgi:HEAT repeat protein
VKILADDHFLAITPSPLKTRESLDDVVFHMTELDGQGKRLWEGKGTGILAALGRLRNGNALVLKPAPSNRVVEIEPGGRGVWEACTQGQINGASTCLGLIRLGLDRPHPPGPDIDSVDNRVRALASKNEAVRKLAIWGLGRLAATARGPDLKGALHGLAGVLRDRDSETRELAGYALSEIGETAVGVLCAALQEEDPGVVEEALSSMARMRGKARAAAPAIATVMKHENPEVREKALAALWSVTDGHPDGVPAMVTALDDPVQRIRDLAASALGSQGAVARDAVPALLKKLQSGERERCAVAAVALAKIDPDSPRVLAALQWALRREEDPSLQLKAIQAIGILGARATIASGGLVKVMRSNRRSGTDPSLERQIQVAAAGALGEMGIAGGQGVPEMIKLLRDSALGIRGRQRVAVALGKIRTIGDDGVRALAETIEENNLDLTETCVDSLKKIWKPGSAALPVLRRVAEDSGKDARVRALAQEAAETITRKE